MEQDILNKICEKMRECGKVLLEADRSEVGVDSKAGHGNFVTKYDKMIQKMLEKSLPEIIPEAVFVGEEEDAHSSIEKGLAFIVDPIDGTTNFIRDYHMSCISVGVTKDGEPYMGAVYNPYLDEMFTAIKGHGAFLNGKQIKVTRNETRDAIVIFGTSPYYEELSRQSFDMAYDYLLKAVDVRRSGSAAIDLCNVACGRADIFFELKLSPWDYAAGTIIVTEAGGKVTTVDGGKITLERPCSIKASNGIAE
ncbi:MAG: inositol monophosphatase [Lachnospiraceae bacterium]|nr:inositol monophosphatase [Lachnospiraceae bacterium]